jgi:hypothetical protein
MEKEKELWQAHALELEIGFPPLARDEDCD